MWPGGPISPGIPAGPGKEARRFTFSTTSFSRSISSRLRLARRCASLISLLRPMSRQVRGSEQCNPLRHWTQGHTFGFVHMIWVFLKRGKVGNALLSSSIPVRVLLLLKLLLLAFHALKLALQIAILQVPVVQAYIRQPLSLCLPNNLLQKLPQVRKQHISFSNRFDSHCAEETGITDAEYVMQAE